MINFINSTLTDACTAGCDCVQVKYDGEFAQLSTANGHGTVTLKNIIRESWSGFDPLVTCTLIGAYRPVTRHFYVHDCWCVEEPPGTVVILRHEPYRARYVTAKIQLKLLNNQSPLILRLVQNHPIAHAERLWLTLPDIPDAKGLVFRKSSDPITAPVRLARWYREMPGELV